MKYALCIGFLLAVLVVGGCATTTAPMSGQIVSAGPVSGPCPYCGQGVTAVSYTHLTLPTIYSV